MNRAPEGLSLFKITPQKACSFFAPRGARCRVTRDDRTKGGEEGKGERGEVGGEEILAHGRVDQSEVLADLKIWSICVGEPIVSKRL